MNKEKIIIGIVITLLVIIGLVYAGKPAANDKNDVTKTGNTGTLQAEEKQYDFGKISMANGKVSHKFIVKNSGAEPVMIKKVYTSCMCTEASFSMKGEKFGPFGMPGHGMIPSIDRELPAGETAEVEAIFDPAAHGPAGVGPIERMVRIEHSSGDPLDLEFKTFVTP